MTKNFCDICTKEIAARDLMAKFESLEPATKALGATQSTNPVLSMYMLCVSCKEEIKKKIVEMVKSNGK